ncbi:MAG: hypothetical protein JRH16_04290 [Deltaproteobacteria bacterium]|nr:hypothetical protein [Deltaproteobacteria bacterium]
MLESVRPTLAHSGLESPREVANALLHAPWHYLRALARPANVDELQIDVQFKYMHQIHERRAEALRSGVLQVSDADLVPATITHAGRIVPVELRLRGELGPGLEGDKWPMRIETADNAHLFGMRRFSLMDPRTRGFQAERFPLAQLRSLDVVAPRAFFVKVVLNGKNVGLMLLEEHIGEEMLEMQERREGVILRFDERPYWDSLARTGSHGAFDNPHTAELLAFRRGRIKRSKLLRRQRATALGLLRGFLDGELPAREVFDLPLLANYLAVAELWRSESALRWNQLRFYLNPITSRLEPVASHFDLQLPHAGAGLVSSDAPIASAMLADAELRRAFVSAAQSIGSDTLDGDLIERMHELERADLALLHSEYPWQAPFDFDRVIRRARALHALREEDVARFGATANASEGAAFPLRARVRKDDAGAHTLELTNLLPLAIEITQLTWRRGDDPARNLSSTLELSLPLTLPATPHRSAAKPLRLPLPIREGKRPRIEGLARVPGHDELVAFRATRGDPLLAGNPTRHSTLSEILDHHDFLRFDSAANRLLATPGRWNVEGSMLLPEGVALELPAGTELRFSAGEGLVARGPLQFSGSPDAPVVLTGPANNDPRKMWSGIAVLGADTKSHWRHVHVHHTGGFDRDGWALTGGITFRKADVTMENCRLIGSRAEDALNIVRSTFALREVHIEKSRSDAFDADFSQGRIDGGSVRDAGGDAIDVSGSSVEVRNVTLQNIGDKALSVGEASRLSASGLVIQSVGSAFVSKDRSRGELRDSTIQDVSHVALAAYVKKPQYGPAELIAENNVIERAGALALAQTGNHLFIDGSPVPEQDVDISQLFRERSMRQ